MKLKFTNAEPVTPDVIYKGHGIFTVPVGRGWRAMIYPPGSSSSLSESPSTLEQCSKEAIIAEAKCVVDARYEKINNSRTFINRDWP